MIVFLTIVIALLTLYCTLLFIYKYWWQKLQPFSLKKGYLPQKAFSIIIPARNEEQNIANCLQSILANDYPQQLYEILIIDDFSTDSTVDIIVQYQQQHTQIKLLRMQELLPSKDINSYKKKAIELAIHSAHNEWIVTTDADCIVPKNWLRNFDNYIQQTNKKFIAAPVSFIDQGNFLSRFQCLDFLSLQGITAASVSAGFHSMCNGANLCYAKELFIKVGGFSGIDNLASGDDMLLMHKIQKQFPNDIGYLFSQDVIVQTLPMPTWKAFINQRIRWASKADSYQDPKILLVLFSVYMLNLLLLLLFVIGIFAPKFLLYWIAFLAIKTVVELLFMKKITAFYQQKKLLKWFPLMQPFHILYTVLAGFFGKFGEYQWKGRAVK